MDDITHGTAEIATKPKIIPVSDLHKEGRLETSEVKTNMSKVVGRNKQMPTQHQDIEKKVVSKSGAAQKRITIMFFVLILAYIISYTPPLIISIVLYAVEDFKFVTMSKAELAMCVYMTRLVFLNHIVNPFVYGYFATMFRNRLRTWCKRK